MYLLSYLYEWLIGTIITLAFAYSPDERLSLTPTGQRSVGKTPCGLPREGGVN